MLVVSIKLVYKIMAANILYFGATDIADQLVELWKYPGSSFYACLFDSGLQINRIITADASNSTFTATQGHNFVDGVRVFLSTGGTLPQPLTSDTTYYTIQSNISAKTFKLSATKNGSPIVISNTGTGTHTVSEQPLNALDDFPIWARIESNYGGSSRQLMDFNSISPVTDISNRLVFLGPVPASFAPTNSSITYRYFGIVRDGNSTRGDSTGKLRSFVDYGVTLTIPSNFTCPFTYTATMSLQY